MQKGQMIRTKADNWRWHHVCCRKIADDRRVTEMDRLYSRAESTDCMSLVLSETA